MNKITGLGFQAIGGGFSPRRLVLTVVWEEPSGYGSGSRSRSRAYATPSDLAWLVENGFIRAGENSGQNYMRAGESAGAAPPPDLTEILRQALAVRGYRTDGDSTILAQRYLHSAQEAQEVIEMQKSIIARQKEMLAERPA